MARTDTLSNFLTDVADSIREKTGKTEVIPASSFDTEIANIETGEDITEYFKESITEGTNASDTNKVLTAGLTKIIKKVPEGIIFNGASCQYMFYCCTGLEEAPLFDMGSITSLYCMFYYCGSLKIVPSYNTNKITDFRMMFCGCSSLTEVPCFDMSSATHIGSMFNGCSKLVSCPQFQTNLVVDMSSMFGHCPLLTDIPELDASSCANVSSMFTGCYALTNFGGLKNLGQAYLTSRSANYSSYKLDLSYSTNLTHDSLMNVINNLYDIATAGCNTQQLVLGSTNKAKLTSEEIAIATNKGWTVS